MGDDQLIEVHDAAYHKAQSCTVYAPPQSVDPSVAAFHATKSGIRSASCGDEWMRRYDEMSRRGLKSLRYPHLFVDRKTTTGTTK